MISVEIERESRLHAKQFGGISACNKAGTDADMTFDACEVLLQVLSAKVPACRSVIITLRSHIALPSFFPLRGRSFLSSNREYTPPHLPEERRPPPCGLQPDSAGQPSQSRGLLRMKGDIERSSAINPRVSPSHPSPFASPFASTWHVACHVLNTFVARKQHLLPSCGASGFKAHEDDAAAIPIPR